jgi:hypothetical protein
MLKFNISDLFETIHLPITITASICLLLIQKQSNSYHLKNKELELRKKEIELKQKELEVELDKFKITNTNELEKYKLTQK